MCANHPTCLAAVIRSWPLKGLEFFPRGNLLLATDFDGTLAPIVQDPDTAVALPANVHLIGKLIHHRVHVAERPAPEGSIGALRILGENGMARVTNLERQALERFNRKAARYQA